MNIRGALHVHSTHSYDGSMSLGELKQTFQKHGLSFACMTEHTDFLDEVRARIFVEECRALSDASFVFIPGFEVPYQDAHVLMIGCERFLGQSADREGLLHWTSASRLTVLAHPVRNHFRVDDPLGGVLDGIEIWNGQYDGIRAPRTRAARLYERLLFARPHLLRTAGLDLHRAEHVHGPVVALEISILSSETIIAALSAGTYTFSDIPARGVWRPSLRTIGTSFFSSTLVSLGKRTNALLKHFGISAPKSLRRRIRAYL